jgi:hypothetical protein
MSKPLVVTISHSLGKEEAVRRLKSGLGSVPATFHHVLAVQEEVWSGNRVAVPRECLSVRWRVARSTSGTITFV